MASYVIVLAPLDSPPFQHLIPETLLVGVQSDPGTLDSTLVQDRRRERRGGKVVSLAVLASLGVKDKGEKTLLSLSTGGAETTAAWQLVVEHLAARHVGRPRLVISDGNPGLAAALERLWPGVAHQRCTVHQLRNLMAKARNTRTRQSAKITIALFMPP